MSESIGHLFKAFETLIREIRTDPFKAITNFKGGVGTMFWSMLTMASPIVYKVTGKRLPAYMMRHAGGLISEFGKLDPANLAKGAYKYFASGLLLFSSSLINLIGSAADEKTKKLTEYITWAFNIFGKELQLAAISSGETSTSFRAKSVEINEIPGLVMKHFFNSNGNNGYQKAEQQETGVQQAEPNPADENTDQLVTQTYLGRNDNLAMPSSNKRNYLRPASSSRRSSSGSAAKTSSRPKASPKPVASKPASQASSNIMSSVDHAGRYSPRKVSGTNTTSNKSSTKVTTNSAVSQSPTRNLALRKKSKK